jgi:hypothetical protein
LETAEQREAIDERRPIEAVWYTGRMMGEACATTQQESLRNTNRDIGSIPLNFRHRIPNLRMGFAKQLEHEIQFYWEYKDGKKALNLVP